MSEHIVYILSGTQRSSRFCGPVFINATLDLLQRMVQHRSGRIKQSQFRIDRLVYVESYDCAFKAEARVRALKSASCEWLDALITSRNPSWQELLPAPIEGAQAA